MSGRAADRAPAELYVAGRDALRRAALVILDDNNDLVGWLGLGLG